jgi:hypothetical protein
MRQEETQSEPAQSGQRLEEALDRLGTLVAPEPATGNDFAARVMQRIQVGAVEPRRPSRLGRRPIRLAIGAAACVVIALALWRTMLVHPSAPAIVANDKQVERIVEKLAAADPPVEAAPMVRTSTWSVVTESVVLEGDVPVRKLLYREFERVEVLDAQGNTASRLIVPTKAMLLASEERY